MTVRLHDLDKTEYKIIYSAARFVYLIADKAVNKCFEYMRQETEAFQSRASRISFFLDPVCFQLGFHKGALLAAISMLIWGL